MAWSLGEDSNDWRHIRTMADDLKRGEYGSGVTATHSGHHSRPMQSTGPVQNQQAPKIQQTSTQNDTPVSQPATQTVSTAHDVGSAEEYTAQSESDSGPATPSIFQTGPGSSETSPGPSYGYSTIFVDGTRDGPDGDYSTEPGSPPNYVNYGGEKHEPSAVPVPEQLPVVPQEKPYTPLQATPVAPAPATSNVQDDLPFSPEYLAILAQVGGSQRGGSAPAPISSAESASGHVFPSPQNERVRGGSGRSCRTRRKRSTELT
jgi:chitinase